jgi:hypothetical protein
MARIRYLKPEFFKDEDLATLPFETRLFYAGLWGLADKAGRIEDRPLRLKAEIFPYDKVDAEKCLSQLAQPKNGSGRPFINRYITDNQRYIQIINWDKHQKPHHTEAESEIPPAPPLMEKGMEKGMGSVHTASAPLNNGETTVKQPLKDENPTKNAEKLTFLEFVKLTQIEYDKLIAKFGKNATDGYIERLNNYVGSKGVRYKSHYHTILNWSNKDAKSNNTASRPNLRDYSLSPEDQARAIEI